MSEAKRVAVIGSGIAGLSAAWLLSSQHDVVIFEKGARLGMDQHGIDVDVSDPAGPSGDSVCGKASARIDVPLRVFSPSYYPHLTSLYKAVGVEFKQENYGTSFSMDNGDSVFSYDNFLLGPFSVPFISPRQACNSTFWRVLKDLVLFLYRAPRHFKAAPLQKLSFMQYLKAQGHGEDFIKRFIVPTLSGICTCSYKSVAAYPASVVMDYTYLVQLSAGGFMRGVQRACSGARDVVSRLSADCKEVHTSTEVVALHVQEDGTIEVESRCLSTGQTRRQVFDAVVVSTQANQAVHMLDKSTTADGAQLDALASVLKEFRYEQSDLVLHSDPSLMPKKKRDWNSVNYIMADDDSEVMASIWMNRVQPTMGSGRQLFQTWNPLRKPKKELTICGATFERPVVTHRTVKALEDLAAHQGKNNIWMCGSYAKVGVPLLETAVTSAVEISEALGVPCPWKDQVIAMRNGAQKGSPPSSSVLLFSPTVVLLLLGLFLVAYVIKLLLV